MAEHVPAAIAVEAAPLVAPQGADWSVAWLYGEGDPIDVPVGWPVSWVGRMEVRAKRGGPILLHLHSVVAADGLIQLGTTTVDSVDYALITASLGPDVALDATWCDREQPFDVELTDGTRVIRLVEGVFVLSREVTTGG